MDTTKRIQRATAVIFLAPLVCLLLFSRPGIAQTTQELPKPHPIFAQWKNVARAYYIVTGTLSLLPSATEDVNKRDGTFTLQIQSPVCLKGDKVPLISGRFTLELYDITPEEREILSRWQGKNVLVFANVVGNVDKEKGTCVYGVGKADSVMEVNATLLNKVRREIKTQEQICQNYPRIMPNTPKGERQRIAGLIKQLQNEKTAQTALDTLLMIKPKQVSFLVDFVDDRSPLPHFGFHFPNPPNFFEAYATYGPEIVTDLLNTTLTKITHESFGSIENGGTEQQRKTVVCAWRVYAFYQQNAK